MLGNMTTFADRLVRRFRRPLIASVLVSAPLSAAVYFAAAYYLLQNLPFALVFGGILVHFIAALGIAALADYQQETR